jgi:hypothetical protein
VRRVDSAALEVALAIGAQAGDPNDSSFLLASSYFSHARKVAFEDMLTNQSFSTVRLFLLLAFYMLAACHRNTASMYLGVAAKAAIVTGLHHSADYLSLDSVECSMRYKCETPVVPQLINLLDYGYGTVYETSTY